MATDDDLGDLEALLVGRGGFQSEREAEEERARRRRLARKRRLERVEREIEGDARRERVASRKGTIEDAQDETNQGDDEDDDDFDMFSGSTSPAAQPSEGKVSSSMDDATNRQQDWDDAEGYYKTTIGEIVRLDEDSFRVAGIIGKGVFSTVLKCTTTTTTSDSMPSEVALKFIRHNDVMAKAAHDEIKHLQRFKSTAGIIPLLAPAGNAPLEYRGHMVLVFPFMEYNLRDVLTKFGKGVGLSLAAVRSYFGQLLAAATHLKRRGVVHCDIKPDNLLVTSDYATVRICDFGSAVDAGDTAEMVTPYLVSRFYRAPEVILGIAPTYAVDLWSLAVTAVELFLGRVAFQGTDNNDMLYVMMKELGAMSNRLIRQHLVQTNKFPVPAHFVQEQAHFVFLRETVDRVSKQPVHRNVPLREFGSASTSKLHAKIVKAKSSKDSRKMITHFADLIKKCLVLDPSKRIQVKETLNHAFFKEGNENAS